MTDIDYFSAFENERRKFIDEDNVPIVKEQIFNLYAGCKIYQTNDNLLDEVYFVNIPYAKANAMISFKIKDGKKQNLGLCLSEQINENELYLDYIATSKLANGKGIGSSMLALTELHAYKNNIQVITGKIVGFGDKADVQNSARMFYKKHDYHVNNRDFITKNLTHINESQLSGLVELSKLPNNQIISSALVPTHSPSM